MRKLVTSGASLISSIVVDGPAPSLSARRRVGWRHFEVGVVADAQHFLRLSGRQVLDQERYG